MPETALSARSITKHHIRPDHTRITALQDVDLDLFAGEVVALVGRSGSGKSTLLHVLGTLAAPDTGRLRIADIDVDPSDDRATARLRREHVGHVFQHAGLLPQLTAEENVALPSTDGVRGGLAAARRLLCQVGLGARLTHRPAHLSGGEQQRVAVARAIVNRPSVLLADEPTGSLDEATEREVMALLRSIAEDGCAVLIVTHNELVAAEADRVLRLDSGQLSNDVLSRKEVSA